MSEYKSPVYNVQAIPVEKIKANDYNPNRVAPPEMKLLEISISPSRLSATMTKIRMSTSLWTVSTVLPPC